LRNGFDLKSNDFTWKQNRLSKDKEALKNSVLNVIKKKQVVAKADEKEVVIKLLLINLHYIG
jgi:hypothetical protein